MERLGDSAAQGGLDDSDPKAMARWMKSMAAETGEDIDGDMIDELGSANDVPVEGLDESSAA